MKAINSNNRSTKKQMTSKRHITFVLFMFLFLFSASNIISGSNPANLNNPINKLTASELETSPALTVENNMIFSFNVPADEFVRFSIYNVKGEEITTLINDNTHNGEVKADLSQASLKNGVYYYSLETGNYKEVRKLNVFSY
jgi:hypothetical protein